MAGNVWGQTTCDPWTERHAGTAGGSLRASRGGVFDLASCTVTTRRPRRLGERDASVGFRVVRDGPASAGR
ncbi:hypothetical protein OAX78_02230 [Planctomycetota bacterium]|nr:hypothetical protein [Planctomycetota bacterium]